MTDINKVGCSIKFVYNDFCFYNFILKREKVFFFLTNKRES